MPPLLLELEELPAPELLLELDEPPAPELLLELEPAPLELDELPPPELLLLLPEPEPLPELELLLLLEFSEGPPLAGVVLLHADTAPTPTNAAARQTDTHEETRITSPLGSAPSRGEALWRGCPERVLGA